MRLTIVTTARRLATTTWLLLIAVLIGVATVTHLATTFVIQGRSMEPAISLGSLIVAEPVAPHVVRVGDVIAMRGLNGVVISHRVTRIAEIGGDRHFEIKGDANRTPDPVLVPAGALIGRVSFSLPFAGYLAAMLGSPSGLVSLLAMLAAGLLLILLAEQLEDELTGDRETAGAAAPEGSPRGAIA